MKHTIPTLLETQDHILFGATAKQIMICLAGLGATGVLWESYDGSGSWFHFLLFVGFSIVPCILALLLAFLKISGQGLDTWSMFVLLYAQIPKVYLWDFLPENDSIVVERQPTIKKEEDE